MSEHQYKVGDRVRLLQEFSVSTGERFEVGLTGTVESISEGTSVLGVRFEGRCLVSVYHDQIEPASPTPAPDMVNHPPHYTFSAIEPIDVIGAWGLGFCDGNALKYLARWKHKNGLEDLRKARWYIDRLIRNLEGQSDDARPDATDAGLRGAGGPGVPGDALGGELPAVRGPEPA